MMKQPDETTHRSFAGTRLAVVWRCFFAAALMTRTAHADDVELPLMSSGAMIKAGYYKPQRLELSQASPAGMRLPPLVLTAPLYGKLMLGPRESPTPVFVVLDEPDNRPSRLFLAPEGGAQFVPAEWNTRVVPGQNGQPRKQASGGGNIAVRYGTRTVTLHLCFYRFDKNDPTRARFKSTLFYYRDYAYAGDITLGGKKYGAMLCDDLAGGDFRGNADGPSSEVRLLVDVNGDGRFETRGESFDVRKPFNIAGTTYEITGLTAAGDRFQIVRSSKTVAAEPPPPNLNNGRRAAEFSANTMDGRSVHFPADFKGRIVLLDFWATWCGPCMAEMPNVSAVYEKFHPRGLEILGISLDNEKTRPRIAELAQKKKMPWPQVCDGKGWEAGLAQLYGVTSIPRAYLVNGDTGEILAAEAQLRGPGLAQAVEAALAGKKNGSAGR
jgi:peroxiredoxin